MLRLSVTGVPDAWASGGRLDSLVIELLLRLRVQLFGRMIAAGFPIARQISTVNSVKRESHLERSRPRGRYESQAPHLPRRPFDAGGPCEHRQGSFQERIYT